MYSSAEPHNNTTTQQQESEDKKTDSSRSEEDSSTGGETIEKEEERQKAGEDEIYLGSQFKRARSFFRSGSHGQISEEKISTGSKSRHQSGEIAWFRDSHVNDDDLLAEADTATSLTTRRAGLSQVKLDRASLRVDL